MADTRFDMVIRNGTVVDGTRMPRFKADIAIKDGKIAEIGRVTGKGKQEIDATNLIVAPGAIDVHTHYDAQLQWDPYASQSCWHGITSIVISACGFGFAPCHPHDRERAMNRMTRVEAIPYSAMKLGMRWDWVTQAEYLNSMKKAGLGVNVASYIPQSPVRGYVLGTEDSSREHVTPAELEAMKELVRDGYRAGAMGLSTDLNLIDRDFDGSMLPSLIAPMEETEALISVAREFNVGSIEVTPKQLKIGPNEAEMLERWANLSGRPIYYNAIIQEGHRPGAYKEALALLEDMNTRVMVNGLGLTHELESLFNLIEYNLFDEMPAWNKALACPLEQRIANLANPEVRKTLQHDLDHHVERLWSGNWARLMVMESKDPSLVGKYVSQIAAERGQDPLDVFCDINVAERLETNFIIEDFANMDDDANQEMLLHPHVIPGLSDGGAHTQFLSLGKYPTILLAKWVRDKKAISLEEAHWRLSHMAAASIGMMGRGMLLPGMPADIMIYDLDKLAVTPERPVYETIIGGGRRLIQKATGYRAILVNGVPTFEYGECTNARPGDIWRTSVGERYNEALKKAAE